MASPPSSPSRAPLISLSDELGDSTSELKDTFDANGPSNINSDRAEGGQTVPSYGSVQTKDEEQQAPPLEEKKKHRASSVVSLTSFGDVSLACLRNNDRDTAKTFTLPFSP